MSRFVSSKMQGTKMSLCQDLFPRRYKGRKRPAEKNIDAPGHRNNRSCSSPPALRTRFDQDEKSLALRRMSSDQDEKPLDVPPELRPRRKTSRSPHELRPRRNKNPRRSAYEQDTRIHPTNRNIQTRRHSTATSGTTCSPGCGCGVTHTHAHPLFSNGHIISVHQPSSIARRGSNARSSITTHKEDAKQTSHDVVPRRQPRWKNFQQETTCPSAAPSAANGTNTTCPSAAPSASSAANRPSVFLFRSSVTSSSSDNQCLRPQKLPPQPTKQPLSCPKRRILFRKGRCLRLRPQRASPHSLRNQPSTAQPVLRISPENPSQHPITVHDDLHPVAVLRIQRQIRQRLADLHALPFFLVQQLRVLLLPGLHLVRPVREHDEPAGAHNAAQLGRFVAMGRKRGTTEW